MFSTTGIKNSLWRRILKAIFKAIGCFFKDLILDVMKSQLMQMEKIDLWKFLNLNFMDTSDTSKPSLVALNNVRIN